MNNPAIENSIADQKNCSACNEVLAADSRFCKYCGADQVREHIVLGNQRWVAIKQAALFYLFDIALCCLALFVPAFKTFGWSVLFDTLLAVVAVAFFSLDWKNNKSILAWRNFSVTRLLSYIILAVAGSLFVSYTIGWLNQTLFSKQLSYYWLYSNLSYGKVIMVIFVAIMPALFEELAYRGYLLQKLLFITENKQAIFISAFLFSIMHMSLISIIWLIPFALLLGYVRVKENTLWYGVVMHFSFNLTVCLIEFHQMAHLA
ncbi:CPBP family glutamic-type intramembrane protease [Mucilaginibacter sp. dw_454]|uniref:CPBP family glutamic-type intramembrane protease n=1 Tax=Mucilaginibacter sp. dw_454 TaxID=2720079 RepID=UPI001BD40B0F|nr:CPBP family glutamic-type intramembrane protease [Mucilaginibacter sp. dw_454]